MDVCRSRFACISTQNNTCSHQRHYMYMCTHIHVSCVCVSVCALSCLCLCVCVCARVRLYTHTLTHTHSHKTYIDTHTLACMFVFSHVLATSLGGLTDTPAQYLLDFARSCCLLLYKPRHTYVTHTKHEIYVKAKRYLICVSIEKIRTTRRYLRLICVPKLETPKHV